MFLILVQKYSEPADLLDSRIRIGYTKNRSRNNPHTVCLHFFRHAAPFSLEIRQDSCGKSALHDEKPDGATCARLILGSVLNLFRGLVGAGSLYFGEGACGAAAGE